MKLKILNIAGTSIGETDLPVQFLEPVRQDLIKKAVLAIQNNKRQAYGAFKNAGMQYSAELSRRRRNYRGSYGHGISRVPRKILSRRGTQMYWVGAVIPGTVGGRKAHPPKPGKKWGWKINTTEKRKAICSAMSAVMNRELVLQRGHLIPHEYPFLVAPEFEKITTTKEMRKALEKLGFKNEMKRAEKPGIRAGKGKIRGRKRTVKKSLLLVVSDAAQIRKAANNIPGIDIINIRRLNAEALAPAAHLGRATLFSVQAIDVLKTGLFLKDYSGESKKDDKKDESEKSMNPKDKGAKQAASAKDAKKKKSKKEKKTKPVPEEKTGIKKSEVKK